MRKEVRNMTKFIKRLGVSLTTLSILGAAAATGVLADNQVSNTGALSHNVIVDNQSSSTTVVQGSNTESVVIADVEANSGNNSASLNTTGGGSIGVSSGAATSGMSVAVTGGSNVAVVPDQCGCPGTESNTIKNTGFGSYNKIWSNSSNSTVALQGTNTSAVTVASVKAKSGKNTAWGNTTSSGGGIGILSGPSSSSLGVVVTGGSNTLLP